MLEVSFFVRCGDSISEPFRTDIGAPQGDCASANSFTYYLAKYLKVQTRDTIIHDYHYHHQSITSHEIPDELTKHIYAQPTQIQHFNIETEYVDDLSKLTSDNNSICRYEHNVEENLDKKGLKVNKNKTESYMISRQNHQWKKCKLLRTLLDTEEDIKRRKILAINAANNLCRFFENSKLTINLKLKLINTYIEHIFLYNSETWTLTKSMEESFNAFQCRIVRRYCFNTKWPKTLRNQDFYKKTKIVEWKKKSHGEKIEVVWENGESTGRVFGQGCIEVRVIQLCPTTRESQNHLDFQSKRKLKRNEPFLA